MHCVVPTESARLTEAGRYLLSARRQALSPLNRVDRSGRRSLLEDI
jgi:hypothetical protein